MPDSLTALAILALVGVPGFVYMQLRGEPDPGTGASSTERSLATVFFGLGCAGAGVALSLWSQQERWVAVLADVQAGGQVKTMTLVDNAPEMVCVSVLGALFSAVLFAGVLRAIGLGLKRYRAKKANAALPERTSVLTLLAVGAGGLLYAGLGPWF